MRKFLVILLCFSFIVTPVSSAYAEEKKSGGQKSMGAYMNQVLGIGTGVVGVNIMIGCKLGFKTPSITLFFAGSLIYIASEFMGASAQKAFLKANTEEVNKLVKSQSQGGGDAQKAIIEKKLQEEEDKLGFVNKRKMWMMAITTVYLAATAAAIAEHFNVLEWSSAGCESGTMLPASQGLAIALGAAYMFATGYSGGGFVTALISALMLLSPFVLQMNVPTTRITAFGIASALSTGIIMSLSSEASKIVENIKKLKELLAKFKKDTDTNEGLSGGLAVNQTNQTKDSSSNNFAAGKIKSLPAAFLSSRGCWANTSKGMEFSESACKNSIRVPRAKLDANLNLPTLQSVSSTATDMAQAVSDGDMARADVFAGQLAANATRMKQVKDNLLKQLNDKLKAKGKKPIDLDKEVKKGIAQIEAGVNKNLASKGFGPMASIGNANLATELPSKDIPVINPQDVGTKAPIAIDNKTSEPMEEALNEDGGVVEEKQATLSESLEGFETTEDDISKRSEDSIFQQLSTRYLLNYHRFFERKKEEEAPAAEP